MTTLRLFTAILFVALYVMTVREIADPDFWWHLRTGQYIVETANVPHSDIYSFTNAGKEWVTHEWLSEVAMDLLYRLGGFPVLILTFSAIITAAFALVYFRSPGRPYLAGFALLLGALATAPTWGVRPQMLSLLLMSGFLFLLDQHARTNDVRYLVPLPFLMLLWVNLHSGYALGLVVLGVYVISGILEGITCLWRQAQSREIAGSPATRGADSEVSKPPLSPRAVRAVFITLIICLVAVLFNPNGAQMFLYPFETLTSRAMQAYIQEWFSPDFHLLEWQPFAWLILALLLMSLLAHARVPLAQTLLLFVLGYAALRSARNIPLFVVVAVPVLATQLAMLFNWKPAVNKPGLAQRRALAQKLGFLAYLNIALLVLVALAGLLRVITVLGNQSQVEQEKFPAAAVEWIRANQPPTQLYNTYHWGGYLIWKLYPEYPVYIDGRADVHGDRFIEEFLNVYRATPGWEDELQKKNVRLVLVEPDAPLAVALGTSPGWRRAFEDTLSVVYVRE